jgi:hypothetical protein
MSCEEFPPAIYFRRLRNFTPAVRKQYQKASVKRAVIIHKTMPEGEKAESEKAEMQSERQGSMSRNASQ